MDTVRMSGDHSVSPGEQLAALGQAVITTDADGVVLGWNPAAEQLYGWTAREAVGRNIGTLCVPELAHDVAVEIMRALRAGVPWSGGFPVRRKDGTLFTALVTDAGIYRDGELVGIVGVSSDLGAALRPLVERSTDAALVLRADAVITYASPAVRQLFGWDEEAMLGTSLLPLLHPDDRDALNGFLANVVRHPGARPAQEVRVRRGEGWAWAEAAITNFLDDPVVRGVVCNLRRSLAHSGEESAEERVARLETALESRLVVERAVGFLAGRHDIDTDAAYRRLLQHARGHHLPLQEVARQVVSGSLDPRPVADG
jgi:PAS domain S-box-containing protein